MSHPECRADVHIRSIDLAGVTDCGFDDCVDDLLDTFTREPKAAQIACLFAHFLLEGPDGDIDRIIRSIRDNGGRVSNKLLREFSALEDEALARELVAAVQSAFSQS